MKRYAVVVEGPRGEIPVSVFAGDSWDGVAEAAVAKIQDKILRHNFKGWGPISGPWKVIQITLDGE
jgi:hypothetical protein